LLECLNQLAKPADVIVIMVSQCHGNYASDSIVAQPLCQLLSGPPDIHDGCLKLGRATRNAVDDDRTASLSDIQAIHSCINCHASTSFL
jgi:hypothetical protein